MKRLNKLLVLLIPLVLLLLLVLPSTSLASANYVLPYPGIMPGHKLYSFEQVIDRLYRFWAFGSFARHQYELRQADKKLVEAKILFEYRQYLLATRALKSSNQHFQEALVYLNQAKKEGKDISQKLYILQSVGVKHQEVLEKLQPELPKDFLWQPENQESTQLDLKKLIEEAIASREI
jgi:hypothetical protein